MFQKNFHLFSLSILTSLTLAHVKPTFAQLGPAVDCKDKEEKPLTDQEIFNAHAMGTKLYDYLDKSPHKLAIVARMGSDMSSPDRTFFDESGKKLPRGNLAGINLPAGALRYTHVGIVMRDHKLNKWFFRHQLNDCGSSSSTIYDQGTFQFFLDGPAKYEAMVVFPSEELQDKLTKATMSNLFHYLHINKYSNIANPFISMYQNSNGWVLNLIAAAQGGLENIRTPDQAIAYYRNDFSPHRVEVDGLKAAFLPLGQKVSDKIPQNTHMNDHQVVMEQELWWSPNNKTEKIQGYLPYSYGYAFVSAESIFNYIENTDTILHREVLTLEK